MRYKAFAAGLLRADVFDFVGERWVQGDPRGPGGPPHHLGIGRAVDIDGDGKADATFSEECGFVLQLRNRQVIAAEADRDVTATIRGKKIALKRHTPIQLPD